MEGYEVSVLILTYHSDYIKLIYTINSILAQEYVKIQIVISDDGSEYLYKNELEEYFKEKNFTDYIICPPHENTGTVKNFIRGLEYCEGVYVKPISPGDFIYQKNTIREWVDFLVMNNAVLSFGETIYYRYENGFVPVVVKAHPQITKFKCKEDLKYNYLVYNDICVGATTLVKRENLKKYLKELEDKVVYAEDHVYRLMIYCNEEVVYFDFPTVLYEFQSGISTSKNVFWENKLYEDWKNANKILSKKIKARTKLDKNLQKVIFFHRFNNSLFNRLRYLFVQGLLKYQIYVKLNTKMTSSHIDVEYLNLLTKQGD